MLKEILGACIFVLLLKPSWSYIVGQTRLIWSQAQSYCQSLGTNLASIHGSIDLNYAQAICQTKGPFGGVTYGTKELDGCWIGLSDQGHEGIFVYVDNTPCDYGCNVYGEAVYSTIPWAQDEPNQYKGWPENCVQMRDVDNFKFNDAPCSIINFPVCNDPVPTHHPTNNPTHHPINNPTPHPSETTSIPISTNTQSTPAPIQILNITSGLRVKHESCHILSSIYYKSSGKWNDRGFCDDKYDCNEIDDSKYQMVDEHNPLIMDIYSMPSINITVEGTMDHPNIKCLKYRYNESEVIINNKMYQFNFKCGCETVDNNNIMCYDCARYFCSDNQPLICYDSNITPSTTDNKATQKPLPSRPITDDDCSYIDFSGPVPTDVCYFKYKSNSDESSLMFECTNDGRIILNKYLNNECNGNPEVTEDYSLKGYNYYCLDKICDDTMKIIGDCMNDGEYWEILRVNNICLNNSKTVCVHNNILTFTFDNEQCDGFPIASKDWQQTQDDTICQITTQCMAKTGGEGATESDDNETEKEWDITDTIIVVVVIIVVIILMVSIIFIVYYYKTKRRDTGSKQKEKESKIVNDKSNTNKISYAPVPTETVTEAEMTEIETLVQNEKQ